MRTRRAVEIEEAEGGASVGADVAPRVAVNGGQPSASADHSEARRVTGDRSTQEREARAGAGEDAAMPEGTNELASSSGVHGAARMAPRHVRRALPRDLAPRRPRAHD